MKPFRSPKEMLNAHEAMFGDAGRKSAEIVLKWANTLFAEPCEALNIRVVLAPVELGPYNRHDGYCYGGEGKGALILGNRHVVHFSNGSLVLNRSAADNVGVYEDFIVHELTHIRQAQLLRQHAGEWGWTQSGKNVHRDKGWYQAIAEAAPKYLGVEVPESVWPKRGNPDTLTEPEMCHWPDSIRALAQAKDPRLPKRVKAKAA
jgi:hypothetical protein